MIRASLGNDSPFADHFAVVGTVHTDSEPHVIESWLLELIPMEDDDLLVSWEPTDAVQTNVVFFSQNWSSFWESGDALAVSVKGTWILGSWPEGIMYLALSRNRSFFRHNLTRLPRPH